MRQMSRRERIQAAINRQPVDRVPYAVWRHFPVVDRSPAGLAQATLRFHDHYGSDFLKITPHGGYAVEAWGCVEAEEVLPDGHRACASCAVKSAEDTAKLLSSIWNIGDPEVFDYYPQPEDMIAGESFAVRLVFIKFGHIASVH